MLAQTITIDQSRRITLPERILETLGITTKDKLLLEMTQAGVLIKPQKAMPLTPVSDWEQMKQETEDGLLIKINEDIPYADRVRFDDLQQRRERLQDDEREEYLQLISLIENKDAERIKYMAELADLRGISIRALVDDLEIFQSKNKNV